jgi:hypothetical protein
VRVPRRQLGVICSEDFFHQYGAICELSSLPVVFGRTRRRIRLVKLGVVVEIDDRISSEHLVEISEIGWFANVSCLVDQIKAVRAGLSLGTDRLLTC